MTNKGKMKGPRYVAPKAISLSLVAQGLCTPGSVFQLNRCKPGGSAGGRCEAGSYPDGGCKAGGRVL